MINKMSISTKEKESSQKESGILGIHKGLCGKEVHGGLLNSKHEFTV